MALTQISTAGVKDDAVTSGKIPANAVGSSELADNAVDTAAIADDAVTSAKIADNSITAGNIAADAVGASEIADNAVDADRLQSNAVTTAKIADGNVTAAKLASGVQTTINNNADNRVITGSGTANTLEGESALTFDGSQNLKVGSTSYTAHSAADNLVVGGTGSDGITILTSDAGTANLFLDSVNGDRAKLQYAHNENKMHIGTTGGTALSIDGSKNVGIGTTSPSVRCDISSSDSTAWSTSNLSTALRVVNSSTTNGVAAGIQLRSFQNNGGASIQYIHAVNDGASSYGSDLVFTTRVAYTGAYRESCRITNAGNLKFPSGHGIDFSASPNAAGMNSELLDRYEEGTWTPSWAGSSGTGTFGYNTQLGKYTRIGRHVFFSWVIIANSHSGTASGALRVAGLPFAVDGSESPSGGTVFFIIGFNASFNTPVVTQLNSSEQIEFYHQSQTTGANYSSVSASSMNLGSLYAKGAGHYIS